MKLKNLLLYLLLACVNVSCLLQEEDKDTFIMEGVIRDDITQQPVANIAILVMAMTPGGIFGGSQANVGEGKTDANGYYRIRIKALKEAERLDYHINGAYPTQEYAYKTASLYLKDLNRNGTNTFDVLLSATTLLKIKFKNVNPFSDTDQFYFGHFSDGNGIASPKGEFVNCGTVQVTEAGNWFGKDVCGILTVWTLADRYTTVYWNVRKNNVLQQNKEKVLVQRGKTNEFIIDY
ncbi:hypothetical protein [Rufibacter soli]